MRRIACACWTVVLGMVLLGSAWPALSIPQARDTDRFIIMAYPMPLRPKMPYYRDNGDWHHRDSMHLRAERIVPIRRAGMWVGMTMGDTFTPHVEKVDILSHYGMKSITNIRMLNKHGLTCGLIGRGWRYDEFDMYFVDEDKPTVEVSPGAALSPLHGIAELVRVDFDDKKDVLFHHVFDEPFQNHYAQSDSIRQNFDNWDFFRFDMQHGPGIWTQMKRFLEQELYAGSAPLDSIPVLTNLARERRWHTYEEIGRYKASINDTTRWQPNETIDLWPTLTSMTYMPFDASWDLDSLDVTPNWPRAITRETRFVWEIDSLALEDFLRPQDFDTLQVIADRVHSAVRDADLSKEVRVFGELISATRLKRYGTRPRPLVPEEMEAISNVLLLAGDKGIWYYPMYSLRNWGHPPIGKTDHHNPNLRWLTQT